MFWWLYHTTANVTDSSERPLILWLVGGPGGSSCGSGNFMVVGPLDEKLNERKNTWVSLNCCNIILCVVYVQLYLHLVHIINFSC